MGGGRDQIIGRRYLPTGGALLGKELAQKRRVRMRSVSIPAFQEIPPPNFGHPFCTRQVVVVYPLGEIRIRCNVYAENNLDGLTPVGAVVLRIEEPKIGDLMLQIVGRYRVYKRRAFLKRGYCVHGELPLTVLRISLPQVPGKGDSHGWN